MKGQIRASISAIAAAAMLVACASKAPASSAGTAPAGGGVSAQDETSAEYQRLIANASKEQLVCKRRAVTGSRIDSQVCLTRAQMEEQQKHADEVMRDIRDTAARQSIPDRPPMPTSAPQGTP